MSPDPTLADRDGDPDDERGWKTRVNRLETEHEWQESFAEAIARCENALDDLTRYQHTIPTHSRRFLQGIFTVVVPALERAAEQTSPPQKTGTDTF